MEMIFNERAVLAELLTKTGILSRAEKVLQELINGDKDKRNEIISKYELDSVRVCQECGELMDDGYLVESSSDTYCSVECLKSAMGWTDEDYEKWSEEWSDNDDIFWTQWC